MKTMFQNTQVSKWMHITFLILLCFQLGSTRKVIEVPSEGTGSYGGGNQGNNPGGLTGISGGIGIGIGLGNGNGNGNGNGGSGYGNGNGNGGSGYGSGSGSGSAGGGGLGFGIGIGIGVPVSGPSGEPLYCVPTNCPNGGNCARFWATFFALASNTTIGSNRRG